EDDGRILVFAEEGEAARRPAQEGGYQTAEYALRLRRDHQFQRRELRRDAKLLGDAVAAVEFVGRVEADVEADRLRPHGERLPGAQVCEQLARRGRELL